MSEQQTKLAPQTKSSAGKSQGAALLASVVVTLFASFIQIRVNTDSRGILPMVELRSNGLGFEMFVLAFSLAASVLARYAKDG